MRAIWIPVLFIISLLLIGCGVPEEGEDSIDSAIGSQAEETDGALLYAQYCESCHKSLSETTKTDRSASDIRKAILANAGNDEEGYMGALSGLIDPNSPPGTKITAITSALKDANPVKGGLYYYNLHCAGCHTSLGTSTVTTKTSTAIQSAINANTGNMGTLSSVTSAQITSIADALQGVTLYTTYCAGCHSVFTSTTKSGRTAAATQSAIDANTGAMGSISLTAAQIKQIATALGGE
ncbi:MAG: hypothetical protein HQM12_04435 [SAR324 cluster bacterium]|nr:hypothetical protein [SAR324 cluster bacterium]